jgi:2-polyprenyl-3-methyl-5-hydroxy-6-metoxy-1,4-benzoquinol methylase/uncharacterized protein YbaR (Trm112 family)
MLRSLLPKLLCPTCRRQEANVRAIVFEEGATPGTLRQGVVVCQGCKAWYPLDDYVLDLEPQALQDAPDRASFRSRFQTELENNGLSIRENDVGSGDFSAQRKQRQHFDAYAESESQSYRNYALQPFWRSVDELTFSRWAPKIPANSHLLDIGCANGRSSLYWARRGVCVTGFDISKKLIREAVHIAQAEGLDRHATYFVGDGRHPPIRDECFDHALTYGVLHHLPEPGAVCHEIQRLLKKGGTHFGSENNQSFFRGIFDTLMKLNPLWNEEAGEQPLISKAMLSNWTNGLAVRIESRTIVYVPPHLCNWLGRRASYHLLRITDGVAAKLGPLGEQGGLLVFEIDKM